MNKRESRPLLPLKGLSQTQVISLIRFKKLLLLHIILRRSKQHIDLDPGAVIGPSRPTPYLGTDLLRWKKTQPISQRGDVSSRSQFRWQGFNTTCTGHRWSLVDVDTTRLLSLQLVQCMSVHGSGAKELIPPNPQLPRQSPRFEIEPHCLDMIREPQERPSQDQDDWNP
ncbi:hypothetical protein ACRALDRAFT_208018 [Sodiomyces alcalophilus JCM 7366]|uniref:uncharacterized protein n=1 Tax=Sodiomyces alcalophilus JCM 7366 TaxID=591952 RepID=UPI0039B58F5D